MVAKQKRLLVLTFVNTNFESMIKSLSNTTSVFCFVSIDNLSVILSCHTTLLALYGQASRAISTG